MSVITDGSYIIMEDYIMTQTNVAAKSASERKPMIYELTMYALMAALICIFAPMSVPIGPIPVSLTNLILYFAIFIIGTRGTLISFIVYLLIGMVGLPVFSGYSGGVAKLVGPTGGYLVGFIPMIIIMGICYKTFSDKGKAMDITATMLGMIVGTIVVYALGTVWFVFQMECELGYALSVCVIPFIPFDLGKMVIANILGRRVRKILKAQGMVR